MEVKQGKTHSELTLQHLEYGSVTGGGWLNPYSILKTFEGCQALETHFRRKLLEEAGITTDVMFFIAWQQLEYLPAFYNRRTDPKRPHTHLDFVNKKWKVYSFSLPIRNSSQLVEDVIVDAETKQPLVHMSVIMVNMDSKSRQPAPFHPLLKKHYCADNCTLPIKIDSMLPSKGQKRFSMPKNVKSFSKSVTVSAFHLDLNFHVNQAYFLDFALNCLSDAFAKSIFNGFTSIFDLDLRRVSFLFLKECCCGDLVKTTVWQDVEDPLIFKFHITKGEDLLCQVEIEFFATNVKVKSFL